MKFISEKYSRKCSIQQTVAQKHLKLHLKRIRDKEYGRLREMVPSIARKNKVSKITVIEEAVKYIDELHKALIERLNQKGSESGVVNETNVKDFVFSLMPQHMLNRSHDTPTYEKQQKTPSYLCPRKQRIPKSM